MFVLTIFGFEWRSSITSTEVLYIILILFFILLLFILYKYSIVLQNRAMQKRLDFQIKVKNLGLSGLQVKIINHIIKLRKLKDLQTIFNSLEIYEASISDILIYFMASMENGETFENICKNIIITYEKVYHHSKIRRAIEKISDIEEDVLLYFYKDIPAVYIGKLFEKSETGIKLILFRNIKDIPPVQINQTYNFFLWRAGDAEYSFKSQVMSLDEGIVSIGQPEEFTRGKEVRHPYIEVNIPCKLTLSDPSYHNVKGEAIEPMRATVLKMNEFEVVLKLEPSERLDYRYTYLLNFELEEFRESIMVIAIAERSITDGNDHFYTCKFIESSEAARTVLHKFIADHL